MTAKILPGLFWGCLTVATIPSARGQQNPRIDPLDARYRPQVSTDASNSSNVWVTSSLAKIGPSARPNSKPLQRADLSAARNEFESFQVHVHAGDKAIELNLQVSDFENARGGTIRSEGDITVFREEYIDVKQLSDRNGTTGLIPDPLIPVWDRYFHQKRKAFPVTVPAGETRSAWIDIYVPLKRRRATIAQRSKSATDLLSWRVFQWC